MNRQIELDNVNAAYVLERILADLKKRREELLKEKPPAPTMPPPPTKNQFPLTLTSGPTIDFWWDYNKAEKLWCTLAVFFFLAPIASFFSIIIFGLLANCGVIQESATFDEFIKRLALSSVAFAPVCFICAILCFIHVVHGLDKRFDRKYARAERKRGYRKKQAKVHAINQKEIAAWEENFAQALAYYDNVTVPAYYASLEQYEKITCAEWSEEMNQLDRAIGDIQASLNEVYSVNIIPLQFRSLEALTYMAAFMGTSYFSLQEAMNHWESEVTHILIRKQIRRQEAQLILMMQILDQQTYSNYLQEETNKLLAQGNETLRSLKHWNIAQTVLAGYQAWTIRKINRQFSQPQQIQSQ